MIKMWMTAVAAMTVVGSVGVAMAADEMKGDAMAAMPTMVCRAAVKGETPTAKLAAGGDLVCKKVDMAKMMKGPAMPDGTSKAADDAAWQKELMQLALPLNGSPS